MKWISVKDRFPNSSLVECIVYVNGKSKIGRYDNSRDLWIFSTVDYLFTESGVTHWTPLPEQPENI